MNSMKNEAARMLLLTCFSEALQQALGGERGVLWQCAPIATDPIRSTRGDHRDALAAGMRLRRTLHGDITLIMAQEDASTLFSDGVGEAAGDLSERWREAIERLVQSLPKRAADTGRFAFSVESQRAVEPSTDDVPMGHIELRHGDGRNAVLQIRGDEELLSSLQVAEWDPRLQRTRSGLEFGSEAQLGRVIDVPLAVTLRFGERQMRLREVLELNTGSLVELDRQVEEPVDLLLGERVIARGEVVIVEGNYGLRVTEIVDSTPVSLF